MSALAFPPWIMLGLSAFLVYLFSSRSFRLRLMVYFIRLCSVLSVLVVLMVVGVPIVRSIHLPAFPAISPYAYSTAPAAVAHYRSSSSSPFPLIAQRINQLDPAQYQNQAEYALWSPSTCSAASMTEVFNAAGGKQYRLTEVLAVEREVGAIDPDLGLVDNAGIAWTMKRFGFNVDYGYNRSLDQVIAQAQQGIPVMVNFPPDRWAGGHFLLVVGGDASTVKLVDSSSLNMQVMSRSRFLSYWGGYSAVATPIAAPVAPSVPAALPGVVSSARGSSVVGGPSLSVSFVDQVLTAAGSPAAGQGSALYALSLQYHIDDAYALAVFQHESSYGTQGAAVDTHGLGNIICTPGYSSCIGRFRSYGSWADGFEDFYRLIAREYVAQGLSTVQTITPVYAPSSDNNDVAAYEQSVLHAMSQFRAGQVA